jgi:hypothetical protein
MEYNIKCKLDIINKLIAENQALEEKVNLLTYEILRLKGGQ